MTQLQGWLLILALLGLLVLAYGWWIWHYDQRSSAQEPDAEAERRAAKLVEELLPERDRQRLAQVGYLEVPSPSVAGRVYLVPGGPGPVEVRESGELRLRLCVEPVEHLPRTEIVLMHKLMIEGDEAGYLRAANILYGSHAQDVVGWGDIRRDSRPRY